MFLGFILLPFFPQRKVPVPPPTGTPSPLLGRGIHYAPDEKGKFIVGYVIMR